MIAWWQSLPAPWRAALVGTLTTLGLNAQTVFWVLLGCAAAAGATTDPQSTWAYFSTHWYGALIGVILPVAYRTKQGYTMGAQIQTLQAAAPPPKEP